MTRKLDLIYSGPTLTAREIEVFEEEIGGRLPEDYKQFLRANNGGVTEPPMELLWKREVEILPYFIALMPVEATYGLRVSLERFRELNPANTKDFLPIASTFNDQDICLAIRGDKIGAVFHTEYTYETLSNGDRVPVDVRMEFLANSFNDFLDGLTDTPPPPYCRITELGTKGTPEDLAEFLADGNSIDATGRDEMTILCIAVQNDNRSMIRACLERGASLSGTIQIAASNGHIHLFQLLLDAGADINERDEVGKTSLDYVGGTALPGERGELNRKVEAALIKLGAIRTIELPEPPPDLPSAWD